MDGVVTQEFDVDDQLHPRIVEIQEKLDEVFEQGEVGILDIPVLIETWLHLPWMRKIKSKLILCTVRS